MMMLPVNLAHPFRSWQNAVSPISMGTFRGLSILHNIMFTFFLGTIPTGGTRVYWYARVEMVLSGNRSATSLMKGSNDPIPVGEYSSLWVLYILVPGAACIESRRE